MFIRLQPGIYSFGSKKCCVKVDNGKINIRIGGGYMTIENFLLKYTQVEVDRCASQGIDPNPYTTIRPLSPKKTLVQ